MTRVPFLLSLLLPASCGFVLTTAPAAGQAAPGFSDIARITDDAFFVVIDRKSSSGDGPRFATATLGENEGLHVEWLSVQDWPVDAELPDDLEACCVLPGETLTVLAAESGVWRHRFGRVFHLELAQDQHLRWTARFLRVLDIYRHGPYARPLDAQGRSYEGHQVEAMVAIASHGRTFLLYAERGGAADDEATRQTARLVWGRLDVDASEFTPLGSAPLVPESLLNDRDSSALHLIPHRNQAGAFRVLSAATFDPDTDTGPFSSILFAAGLLSVHATGENLIYEAHSETEQFRLMIPAIKIEGLTSAPAGFTDQTFVIASDDEAYGGIIRPVRWASDMAAD